jgi:AcrR family transcriptional regulator
MFYFLAMKRTSTRERILRGALEILETRGIKSFSQQAVAKLIGISQGQLTYHFQKRSDLILALTEKALDPIAEFLWERQPDRDKKTIQKLLTMVLEQVRSKTRVRTMLGLVVEADESEEIRKQLIAQGQRIRMLISVALQVDQDAPEVTMAHAMLLGQGILSFVQQDPAARAKLDRDFLIGFNFLLDQSKSKRKAR